MIRTLSAAVLALVLAGGSAIAHTDPNADGDRYSTTRCDTYYRDGHQTDAAGRKPGQQGYNQGTAHSEDHTSEFDPGQVGVVQAHQHSGHYVVRHDAFYAEVVGGQGYNRDGNQGGFAQGEVDPVEGGPDADFHAGAYAGTAGEMHSENACMSAADNKVGESGQQDVGITGTYCALDTRTPSCTFTARENGLRVYALASSGIRILVKRPSQQNATIHNVNQDGPFFNESRSYAIKPGDVVTCTLSAGSAPERFGRLECGA